MYRANLTVISLIVSLCLAFLLNPLVALFFVLTLVSAFAFGAGTLKGPDGTEVRLQDSPCVSTAGVLANMPANLHVSFKAASVLWEGKTYEACYADNGDGTIYLVDEAGDAGALPKSVFKEDTST